MRIYAWARYHAVVTLAHVQSNPFYHPFYPNITHVRKDTRPSPAFPYCKRRKAGRGLGTRLGRCYTAEPLYSRVVCPEEGYYTVRIIAEVKQVDMLLK